MNCDLFFKDLHLTQPRPMSNCLTPMQFSLYSIVCSFIYGDSGISLTYFELNFMPRLKTYT